VSKDIHVVLGASGATGQAVIAALQAKHLEVRAVTRSNKIPGVTTVFADLFDEQQTVDATKGATYVYLCAGLPYTTKIWQNDWPRLMQAVINACAINNAELIFFDNVYMYGPAPLPVPFDENSPQNPATNKGLARKQIADALLEAHRSGKIRAVIGRSADFYGPEAVNSPFYIKFLERIIKAKQPQMLSKSTIKRTYAYSMDNGRALVELALDPSCYGQTWHLPVGEATTMDNVLAMINEVLGAAYKVSYLPRPLLTPLSWVSAPIKEMKEMLYQFDEPYVMSDKKFRAKFPNFKSTPYETGLQTMLESFSPST